MITADMMRQRQSMPLELKILMTESRIRQWGDNFQGDIYISYSGGKDSEVLKDIASNVVKNIKSVFCNTGLEYPEVVDQVKSDNSVIHIRPGKPFQQIIKEHGFPVVSKENAEKIYQIRHHKSQKTINTRLYGGRNGNGKLPNKWHYLINAPFEISSKCCDFIKKKPFKKFEKETGLKPMVGTMTTDSRLRGQNYMRHGCNEFNTKRPMSKPMSFWTTEDVWEYIRQKGLKYSKIYDMGYKYTGCAFCMFGIHLEKESENRFQRMKKTHPKMHNYCINKLNLKLPLEFMGIPF